jgi:hypothetical protein
VNAEFFEQTSDHDPSVARFLVDQAPAIDAGGPYAVPEGGAVTLSATPSDPDGDPVSVEWDLDGDGTFEANGESVTFSAAALDGPSTVTVTARASDGAATATDTATVQVANVAPSAVFTAPATAPAGFAFTITLASPSDPSAADTAAGFTYSFDCGSGYGPFSSSTSATCPTSAAGSLTVGGRVRDKDGGTSEYRATVAVGVTFDSLCDLTRAYSNDPAVAAVLCAVLDAAERVQIPVLRQAILAGYRLGVALETGNRPRDAFSPTEGATLQRLSRSL